MDFQAIFDNYKRTITEHYFDMTGRVGRAQFWYFVLANFIATILAAIVGGILGAPISEIYTLAVLFPATCLAARRLQDTGRNGKLAWMMLGLIAIMQILIIAIAVGITAILMAIYGSVIGTFLFLPVLSILGLLICCVGLVLIWFWCQPGDPGTNAYGPVPPVFDPSRPSIVS